MGNEYKLFLLDEFDWGYGNINKIDVRRIIESAPPIGIGLSILSDLPHLIIVDCERQPPSKVLEALRAKGVPFDNHYYQANNDTELEQV